MYYRTKEFCGCGRYLTYNDAYFLFELAATCSCSWNETSVFPTVYKGAKIRIINYIKKPLVWHQVLQGLPGAMSIYAVFVEYNLEITCSSFSYNIISKCT